MNWTIFFESKEKEINHVPITKKVIVKDLITSNVIRSENFILVYKIDSTSQHLKELSLIIISKNIPEFYIFLNRDNDIEIQQDSLVVNLEADTDYNSESAEKVNDFFDMFFKKELNIRVFSYKEFNYKIELESVASKSLFHKFIYLFPTEELEIPILSTKYFYKPLYKLIDKFKKKRIKIVNYIFYKGLVQYLVLER